MGVVILKGQGGGRAGVDGDTSSHVGVCSFSCGGVFSFLLYEHALGY